MTDAEVLAFVKTLPARFLLNSGMRPFYRRDVEEAGGDWDAVSDWAVRNGGRVGQVPAPVSRSLGPRYGQPTGPDEIACEVPARLFRDDAAA